MSGAEGGNQGTALAHTRAAAENSGEADLFAALDEEIGAPAGAAAIRRGPGRPKGSPDRTTVQFMRWARSRGYRDPAEWMLALISRDPREVAKDLLAREVTGEDVDVVMTVLAEQGKAAAKLMPYAHKQLPHEVEHSGDPVRHMILIAPAASGAEARIIEGNQGAGGPAAAPSHGASSHGES